MPRRKPTVGPRSLRYVIGRDRISHARARQLARALAPAMVLAGATTPTRASMLIAQWAHESAGFQVTEEFASGAAYEGREDLGNTRPGDGRRYKGRGRIMVTGRANYRHVTRVLRTALERKVPDFEAQPHRLARSPWAELASAIWWRDAGCNQICDRHDFIALTRRINGGTMGLPDRQVYYRRARRVARWLTP